MSPRSSARLGRRYGRLMRSLSCGWSTRIVGVEVGLLLEVEGCSAAGRIEWPTRRPARWRGRIECETVVLSTS